MNAPEIYTYSNYTKYLEDLFAFQNLRAWRSKLAHAINCQSAYITRVFKGDADFSLEQADFVNEYLGHNTNESHYLMLLVQRARSGTNSLRSYFEQQISRCREEALSAQRSQGTKRIQSTHHKVQYYSDWLYSAVHVALSIPELKSKKNISKYFALSETKVANLLDFLIESGLVEKTPQGLYQMTNQSIHVAKIDPMVINHHRNWRLKSMAKMTTADDRDLFFTGVSTISRSDFLKIKGILSSAIKQSRRVVQPSKGEQLCCYNIDLFSF